MDYNIFKENYLRENSIQKLPENSNKIGLNEGLDIARMHANNFRMDETRIDQLYECLLQIEDLQQLAESLKMQYKKQIDEYERILDKNENI